MSVRPPAIFAEDPVETPTSLGIRRVELAEDERSLLVTYVPTDALDRRPEIGDARRYAITGGARLHPHVVRVQRNGQSLQLFLDSIGDFSVYTLTLVADGVDPFFASRRFHFRLGCEDPFDCRPQMLGMAGETEAVPIDYLAKDYASFRQALLDFVASRFPQWTERSEADLGIALLELFAATGDGLSYMQDRVANEAFLSTATQRRSVRGHLALLGYDLDEGSAASTWVQFAVSQARLVTAGFKVRTRETTTESAIQFETVEPVVVRPEYNELPLFDWGHPDWCITKDSTSATLRGAFPWLRAGDELLMADDRSGARDVVRLIAPPSPLPRGVPFGGYAGYRGYSTSYGGGPIGFDKDLTVIQWSKQTPLHADYCVGTSVMHGNLVRATHGATTTSREVLPGASDLLASDGAVVVPHSGPLGTTFHIDVFDFQPGESIERVAVKPDGKVESTTTVTAGQDGSYQETYPVGAATANVGLWQVIYSSRHEGGVDERRVARWFVSRQRDMPARSVRPPRLRIALSESPLTFVDRDRIPTARSSTSDFAYERRSAPQLTLTVNDTTWSEVATLLDRSPDDEVYRVETDENGDAELVFGRGGEQDGAAGFGRRPPAGSTVELTYRVGNGAIGNVASDSLVIVEPGQSSWLISVTNPLPASGGRDAESLAHAKRVAPEQARRRLVAVTPADYEVATQDFRDGSGEKVVARANVTFRWTGSWLTASLALDPAGGVPLDQAQAAALRAYLDGRRLAGYELELREANYLPLQLELGICVAAGFAPAEVKRNVELAVGGATRPDGVVGFFHPDHFSFGQPVYLSQLIAAAMGVPGVVSATVERLAPLHDPMPAATTAAVKRTGSLHVAGDQIIQLDADPNHPERGRLGVAIQSART